MPLFRLISSSLEKKQKIQTDSLQDLFVTFRHHIEIEQVQVKEYVQADDDY